MFLLAEIIVLFFYLLQLLRKDAEYFKIFFKFSMGYFYILYIIFHFLYLLFVRLFLHDSFQFLFPYISSKSRLLSHQCYIVSFLSHSQFVNFLFQYLQNQLCFSISQIFYFFMIYLIIFHTFLNFGILLK